MTEKERKKRPCSACGNPVGTATIVVGGDYPDAPLCAYCFNTDYDELLQQVRERLGAK